jgi:hypothetical protein
MNKQASVISEVVSDIDSIDGNAALYETINFNSRADAIDFIDFHILDRIEGWQQDGSNKEPDKIRQRAGHVQQRLEKINSDLFAQLRENIRKGVCTGPAVGEMITKYTGYAFGDDDQPATAGYDNLDVFINGLLIDRDIPEPTLSREPGMVFYQQTPARIIFELAVRAQLTQEDFFFDIGSGLGQVSMLVHLFSGAKTAGIEYEPAYCNYAKNCAALLNLPGAEFINADARKGDYSRGTVFFMYTPFKGQMLEDVLALLQLEAQKRTIRLFTYGPCSPQATRQSWLKCIRGNAENPYELVEFRSGGEQAGSAGCILKPKR